MRVPGAHFATLYILYIYIYSIYRAHFTKLGSLGSSSVRLSNAIEHSLGVLATNVLRVASDVRGSNFQDTARLPRQTLAYRTVSLAKQKFVCECQAKVRCGRNCFGSASWAKHYIFLLQHHPPSHLLGSAGWARSGCGFSTNMLLSVAVYMRPTTITLAMQLQAE